MASTIFTFDWDAIFFFATDKKPFSSTITSSSFGNDNAKFILSAEIFDNAQVKFYLKLKSCCFAETIVCILQCFNSKQIKKLEISYTSTFIASKIATKDIFISDHAYDSRSAKINLKIIFFDKKQSNFSSTWSSFGSLNSVNQAEALCEQLSNLKINSTLADVIIVADGKEFKVHSVVLAMRSPVFEAMLSDEGHFKESKEKKVEIKDIDSHVMEVFIAFLYGQKNIEWKSIAGDLAKVADKYDVQPLYAACAISLAVDVTVEVAAKNFYFALQFEMTSCMREIAQFIFKNKTAVKATDGWKEYFQANSELFEALFEADEATT